MSPPTLCSKKADVRRRVLRAVISCCGTATSLVGEALVLGVIVGGLTPVPMLGHGAELLLTLYDGAVDTHLNNFNYLGLVGRAADKVFKMAEEVHKAGDAVAQVLSEPLQHLEDGLNGILNSMEQTKRLPCYQRFLKRREIEREITSLDKGLTDILDEFSRIIQLTILRCVIAGLHLHPAPHNSNSDHVT